ncbi:MAG: hypothetical protein WC243_02390, partial [Patescibacteria group bacterium]
LAYLDSRTRIIDKFVLAYVLNGEGFVDLKSLPISYIAKVIDNRPIVRGFTGYIDGISIEEKIALCLADKKYSSEEVRRKVSEKHTA